MHQLFDLNIGRFVKVATFKFMAASWEAYQALSATACDENDAIATVLEAAFEMAEVANIQLPFCMEAQMAASSRSSCSRSQALNSSTGYSPSRCQSSSVPTLPSGDLQYSQ